MNAQNKKDFLKILVGDPDNQVFTESYIDEVLERTEIFHILAAKRILDGKEIFIDVPKIEFDETTKKIFWDMGIKSFGKPKENE